MVIVSRSGIRNRPATSPRRSRGRAANGGFTLIETIMMIGIATIGMAAILYLTAIGSQMSMAARTTTTAYAAAKDLIEWYRQAPFTSIVNTTNASFGTAAGQIGYSALSQLPGGTGKYTMADYQGNSTIKQLTVTVSWASSQASPSVMMTTLISQYGLNERWK